jgi:hypothetical protein
MTLDRWNSIDPTVEQVVGPILRKHLDGTYGIWNAAMVNPKMTEIDTAARWRAFEALALFAADLYGCKQDDAIMLTVRARRGEDVGP